MEKRYVMALALSGASLFLLWYVFSHRDDASQPPGDRAAADYYDQRDWDEGSQSNLNISVFTFRDSNRNGRYDLGDWPMAAVAVRLARPDGKQPVRRSNINGFANFSMSLDGAHAEVDQPGEDYFFELLLPPGWELTTGNPRQQTRFIAWPGSVAGLVAQPPPSVVGLAPALTLTGRIGSPPAAGAGQAPAGWRLSAIDPAGHGALQSFDSDGRFSLPVSPGQWRLELRDDSDAIVLTRSVSVRDAPVVLSTLDPGRPPQDGSGEAAVQDFEYLRRSTIDKIPNGQLGLGWDFLLAVDNQVYRGPGYVNGLMSGSMVGYNSSGHPATVSALEPGENFDFVGAYFAAAWASAEGELLQIKAWRGEQLVGEEAIALSHLGPVWFQADFAGIDRLEMATEHYTQFVTDDMRFRLPASRSGGDAVYFDDIPDLGQFQPGRGWSDDGALMCAPLAVSNSLAWLQGNRDPDYQLALADKLAGQEYMHTSPRGGTGVSGLVRGLQRYLQQTGESVARLEYAGWRTLPGDARVAPQPTLAWLRGGLRERGAVWLNIGWYSPTDGGDWQRRGGHWVTLAGYRDGGLIVHDPGPWADAAGRAQWIRPVALTAGRLVGNNSGLPVPARGYFKLDMILPPDHAGESAVLDGAVLLELAADGS